MSAGEGRSGGNPEVGAVWGHKAVVAVEDDAVGVAVEAVPASGELGEADVAVEVA